MCAVLLDQNGSPLDIEDWSEFKTGGYDRADIIKALYYAIQAPAKVLEGEDNLIESISRRFNERMREDFFEKEPETFGTIRENISAFHTVEELDTPAGQRKIDVRTLEDRLFEGITDLLECAQKDKTVYCEEYANTYLDTFWNLSKNAVFSRINYNLYNPAFRRSRFLRDLLSLAAERKVIQSESKQDEQQYFIFSLFDPFAYDTLQRILAFSTILKKAFLSCENEYLTKLRYDLFLCSAKSAFHRIVCLDHALFRVELNRHRSQLIAYPFDHLSSTVETKPIRLFEKIATYIRNNYPHHNGNYKLSVCIIGYTEKSSDNHEKALADLCCALLNWYDNLCLDDGKPDLDLTIHIVSNSLDITASKQKNSRSNFSCKSASRNHKVVCEIEDVDYAREFGFNMSRLTNYIDHNQLIFLMDCPWLSTENLELKQNGSIEAFCGWLNEHRRADPPLSGDMCSEYHAFYSDSASRALNDQYSRIMSSPTTKAGEIVRVLRDPLIRNIQSVMESYRNSGESKELYIFSSEHTGIQYSYAAAYPLTRHERYDGKSFTIIQFRSTPPRLLTLDIKAPIQFRINLWSVLKYISVSFSYTFFREILETCFEKVEEPHLIFELYRSILICGNVSNSMQEVVFSVRFSDAMDDCLRRIQPEIDCSSVKRALWEKTVRLVRPLYVESLFSPDKQYGDDALKTGFIMNLCSSLDSVRTMLFWHRYRMACRKNDFSGFHVKFDDMYTESALPCRDTEFEGKDFFMDKKVYDSLLFTLEQTTQLTIGMQSMLYDAEKVFDQTNLLSSILKNICAACEASDYKDNLFYNALNLERTV